MHTVLLVEDNRLVKKVHERTMQPGYEVVTASNGEEALKMARQFPPAKSITAKAPPWPTGC